MEELIAQFIKYGFDQSTCEKIVTHFHARKLDKGDYFVEEGKTSRYMAFLASGMLQYFSLNELGEEKTTYISLPDTFVASLLSYLAEQPARENIRAIAPSIIWIINKKDVISLQQEIPAFKDFYIQLIEWQICCIDKGKFDLITLNAEQRYQKLLAEEPELLLKVPLQYIASMLGVTPRHLSRLRGKQDKI